MYACDYLENGVLNVLRGVTFAAPAKVYLALYLNDPGEDGASGTEVSYAGYKRIEIDFSSPAETNGGIGVQNLEDITFPTPGHRGGHHYTRRYFGLPRGRQYALPRRAS